MNIKDILIIIVVGNVFYYLFAIVLHFNILRQALIFVAIILPFYLYFARQYLIKLNHIKVKQDITKVDYLNGYEFEFYLKDLFEAKGYKVIPTSLASDQGADLIVVKDNVRTAIQAKRYSKPVGNKAVQEVMSAKGYYRCHEGIVITNNVFTRSAMELASRLEIELWDRKKLKEFVNS